MRSRATALVLATGMVLSTLLAAVASGAARTIDAACIEAMPIPYVDVTDANVHGNAVACVSAWGIVQGSSPGEYSPADQVTRAQLATFITRTIVNSGGDLDPTAADAFDDDDGNPHERTINALAAAGIVSGVGDRSYDPGGFVTRAQMATFLTRAFEYAAGTGLAAGPDAYVDDDGNAHEAAIDKASEAGFAAGTSPYLYSPAATVRRDAMASFVARVLDKLVADGHTLAPPIGPPMPPTQGDTTTPPPPSGGGEQGAPPPPPVGDDQGLPPALPGLAAATLASTNTYAAAAIRVDHSGLFSCEGVKTPQMMQNPVVASSGYVAWIPEYTWRLDMGGTVSQYGQWLWSYRGSGWQYFSGAAFHMPPAYNGYVGVVNWFWDYDLGRWSTSSPVTAPNILGHGGGTYWCHFNAWGLIGAGV